MNWFVEVLQGSGKSKKNEKLSGKYPDHQVFREGDYNPVELALCAYVSKEKYEEILDTYKELRQEIEEKIFPGRYMVLKSKNYEDSELDG